MSTGRLLLDSTRQTWAERRFEEFNLMREQLNSSEIGAARLGAGDIQPARMSPPLTLCR